MHDRARFFMDDISVVFKQTRRSSPAATSPKPPGDRF